MKYDFLQKIIHKIRDYFTDNGFSCDSCGTELFDYPTHRLCAECEGKMRINNGRVCKKCGRTTLAEGICLDCKSHLPQFTVGMSPFIYRGETAALINRVKNGKPTLAAYFAEQMAAHFLAEYPDVNRFLEKETLLIIPVPLTKNRRRERGYNQAERLAEIFCKELQKKGYQVEVDTELLQKMRETEQQKHMGSKARRENVSGAYHVHKRKQCRGKTIVLIDDIMTTGSTGSECSARLLGAGANEVIFLTAASLPEMK